MKTKAFLFLITFGMIITSCDKYNYIHYTMENKTEDSIKITYSFVKSYFDTQATDTTVFLKENQKDTLFIFEQISPTVYDPEEGDKMIYIFNVNTIKLKDNTNIKKDISQRKNWIFKETGKNAALMELTINESDF